MGGQQKVAHEEKYPYLTKMLVPTDKHKRICLECHTITYAFECCGKRTKNYREGQLLGSFHTQNQSKEPTK